jgi:hypothetical protein
MPSLPCLKLHGPQTGRPQTAPITSTISKPVLTGWRQQWFVIIVVQTQQRTLGCPAALDMNNSNLSVDGATQQIFFMATSKIPHLETSIRPHG